MNKIKNWYYAKILPWFIVEIRWKINAGKIPGVEAINSFQTGFIPLVVIATLGTFFGNFLSKIFHII